MLLDLRASLGDATRQWQNVSARCGDATPEAFTYK
jgi:hypothetical protein